MEGSATSAQVSGVRTSRIDGLTRSNDGTGRLNELSGARAEARLSTCCASRRWACAVAALRPFTTVDALRENASRELAALTWPDVLEALDAHPRIGRRPAGDGPEAAWSRAEQAGVSGADAVAAQAALNAAYEARFGFIFLIRAAGRSAQQILDAARDRLGNDEPTEQAVVRDELDQIMRLRLDRMLDDLGAAAESGGPR
ncbi:MAG TPA: 2-oxo-4-hydroxy-4-carboxy-5-ureidoimidazoline decarboxylase [Actinocrinis sp.]|jgi:2-oxo-4-hydroxy-4-carboxy-5-ureidoimidazoline decarboxylase